MRTLTASRMPWPAFLLEAQPTVLQHSCPKQADVLIHDRTHRHDGAHGYMYSEANLRRHALTTFVLRPCCKIWLLERWRFHSGLAVWRCEFTRASEKACLPITAKQVKPFNLLSFFFLLFSLFVAWYTPLHFEENIIKGVVLYPISGEQF